MLVAGLGGVLGADGSPGPDPPPPACELLLLGFSCTAGSSRWEAVCVPIARAACGAAGVATAGRSEAATGEVASVVTTVLGTVAPTVALADAPVPRTGPSRSLTGASGAVPGSVTGASTSCP